METDENPVVGAMRSYLAHEPPLHPRSRYDVDGWLWNLADNGYGEYSEDAVESVLHEYGDELFEDAA